MSATVGVSPAEAVARGFADAINSRNAGELARLMTEDHVFIDSLGTRVDGREMMTAGWTAYFKMAPDYAIMIEEIYSNGPVVAMLGYATGSYAGSSWRTPAAWRAVVRESLVAEWRVYADNEPMRALMRREPRVAG